MKERTEPPCAPPRQQHLGSLPEAVVELEEVKQCIQDALAAEVQNRSVDNEGFGPVACETAPIAVPQLDVVGMGKGRIGGGVLVEGAKPEPACLRQTTCRAIRCAGAPGTIVFVGETPAFK